ncbi:MAG TPA: restriction endonuclease [Planctomycetota bacterium]|nr:restriction endonuclease [Planctomycetota bacterium]
MNEFLSNGMAAIGWPDTGDLTGCDRNQILSRIKKQYPAGPRSLGQTTGIVDRFVNQVKVGDAVAVPDGDKVYFGKVSEGYSFKEQLVGDDLGYPHWIGVHYVFGSKPLLRSELPALLFDSLKGQQAVFGLPPDAVWDVINHPKRFLPVDTIDQDVKTEYIRKLSCGQVPGISSPRFEEAVQRVLSLYYPGLQRLPTKNAPNGGDTDLKTSLPGGVVIRVQVKCYQDHVGEISEAAVRQLRESMELGEHGIVVTTNRASEKARKLAESDPQKPIGIIDGPRFAEIVFENLEQLKDQDIWALGLRRSLTVR